MYSLEVFEFCFAKLSYVFYLLFSRALIEEETFCVSMQLYPRCHRETRGRELTLEYKRTLSQYKR
jgi:hypothetical protein